MKHHNNPIKNIDDVRIDSYTAMLAPEKLITDIPVGTDQIRMIADFREQITNIMDRRDDRLMAVVGPCSIHDVHSATEYAVKLKTLADELKDVLLIVMRIYFEKPRTTIGWKGMINDPDLDETFNINKGLRQARELMLNVTEIGLPIATEFLDLISPQYIADLVSWGAIGARTTESQGHRELASGLSCPVGFKNGTSGDINVARDAILSSTESHIFMSINKAGYCSVVKTQGNPNCHIILRGGKNPNYEARHITRACECLGNKDLPERVMIDFSHGNSLKQHKRQLIVAEDIAQQIQTGEKRIFGIMAESFLEEGSQPIQPLEKLTYGKSITDSCIGWQDTEKMFRDILAPAIRDNQKN